MKTREQLFEVISNFKNKSVLVIGDIILDEYIWGKASRLSPEAPVPVLEVSKYTYILGGAANVANNIAALGGKAALAGVVGSDNHADIIINLMTGSNINSNLIIKDTQRPTTVKTRLVAHNHQQLARADREVKEAISKITEDMILSEVDKCINNYDVIVLSDYAKGVLTNDLIQNIMKMAGKINKPVIVDPKGLDFTKYSGAFLITPNRLETELAIKQPSGTNPEILAKMVSENANVSYTLVTLGEDGILLYSKDNAIAVPAVTSDVYDVTGAGDSLISTVALSIPASNFDIETSVILGNYSAGVAVRKTGTTTVSPAELKNIIELSYAEQEKQCI